MITTVTIDDTKIGQVISPGPDQFIVKMVLTKSQSPAWQQENHFALPYPHGQWRSGRFVIRDGAGHRLINLSTQSGALVASHALMTAGQAFGFSGDLMLECLPRGQEWEISFSDTAVTSLRVA